MQRKKRNAVLDSHGIQYDVVTADEINRRFPLLNVPRHHSGILEHKGGMLLASKCVSALQKEFVKRGGTLRDSEQVVNILPGSVVGLVTASSTYHARAIIITAGPFCSKLTKPLGLNLPLKVKGAHACYWKLKDEMLGSTSVLPSFLTDDVYGLACYEYPGLIKICQRADPFVAIDYPNTVADLTQVTEFIRRHTRSVEDMPSIVEECLYTETPDLDFILDVHPKYHNIVIGAGFSGTGFKMAPVTGNILADLALGKKPLYDISQFSMKRFPAVVNIKTSL